MHIRYDNCYFLCIHNLTDSNHAAERISVCLGWRNCVYFCKKKHLYWEYVFSQSFSSVGGTVRCGLWPVEKYLSVCPYLSPTLCIFSLSTLEDLFPLLSILSWVFLFVSSLPVLEWRSSWASYPPPFSPGDPTNLFFAPITGGNNYLFSLWAKLFSRM